MKYGCLLGGLDLRFYFKSQKSAQIGSVNHEQNKNRSKFQTAFFFRVVPLFIPEKGMS